MKNAIFILAIAAGYLHSLAIKSDCSYSLIGDVNDDCGFDMDDLAIVSYEWLSSYDLADLVIMAENWLIDCDVELVDEACVPK